MRAVLLLVAALVAVASAQWQSGHWTSDYGGPTTPWAICVIGNNFYATYSKIGFVQGTINGLTMTGKFYEAGYTYDPDKLLGGYNGDITLTLNNSTYDVTGTYDDSITGSGTWALTHVDFISPASTECWSPTGAVSGSIAGNSWGNSTLAATWDFCAGTPRNGENYVESSYYFDDGADSAIGGSFGLCFDNGQTCVFDYAEELGGTPYEGQWLVHQVSATQFYAFGWLGFPNAEDGNWYNPTSDNFGFYIFNSAASAGDCDRYSYLYSSASGVAGSLLLITFALVFVLFM